MEDNGDIYLDKYAGWYSVRDEAYYAEDETHLNEHKVRLARRARRSNGSRRKAISSACQPIRTNF
jgi:methionyl-tRNA synthetase